jgi:hypothetical protein
MLCVTPRQTCLQPSGIGRNLRSKTRWFTGFCNSHQVSHFATFFIDARAEISVAESRFVSLIRCQAQRPAKPGGQLDTLGFIFLGAFHAGIRYVHRKASRGTKPDARSRDVASCQPLPPIFEHVHGSFCWAGFDNDPSAGSPTETLLRLLLPLNDKVQWTSRDVAGGEPPTSPRSEHFTGPFNR